MGWAENGPKCEHCGTPVDKSVWVKPGFEQKPIISPSKIDLTGCVQNRQKACSTCKEKGCLNCMAGSSKSGEFHHFGCRLFLRQCESGELADGNVKVCLSASHPEGVKEAVFQGQNPVWRAITEALKKLADELGVPVKGPLNVVSPLESLISGLLTRQIDRADIDGRMHLRQCCFELNSVSGVILSLQIEHQGNSVNADSQGNNCLEAMRTALAIAAQELDCPGLALGRHPSGSTGHPLLYCSLADAILGAMKVHPFYFSF